MILRFRIPRGLHVTGPTQESCEVQTTFPYKRLQCSIGLDLLVPPYESFGSYDAMASGFNFTVREDPPGTMIQSLVNARDYKRLATIMRVIINRCLRAIRTFGRMYSIHELPRIEDHEAERLLGVWFWRAEVSGDGRNWIPAVQESRYFDGENVFNPVGLNAPIDMLDMRRWVDIEKAIQDDWSPSPEQEFTVNASEHLYLRNFRLALIESIIGLEIVLSRYLSTYLRVHKKVPEARIREFLTPNLTLNTRLSGLLDLTLPPDVLQQVDLDIVRKAVRWRNQVVHRTGQLPDGIANADLREAITAVLDLTQRLGTLAQQVEAEASEVVDE